MSSGGNSPSPLELSDVCAALFVGNSGMSGGGSASDFILKVRNAALPSYPVWAAAAAATPAWPAAVATLHRGIACLCGPGFPGELGPACQGPTLTAATPGSHEFWKGAQLMWPCCDVAPVPVCPPSGSVLYAAVSFSSREKCKTPLLALSAGAVSVSLNPSGAFSGPEARTSSSCSNIFAPLPLRWHLITIFV